MNAAGANQGPSQDTPHSLNALLLALLLLLASLQEKKKKGCRRRGTANVQRRFPSYVPFTPFGPLTEELAAS